jgi:hypothetical protein
VAKRELHQLDLTKNQNLKLVRNRLHRKELGRSKVAGPGVVDQNVKVTSFSEREIECLLNAEQISQVETHRMASRHFRYPFQIAGSAPNLVTLRDQ